MIKTHNNESSRSDYKALNSGKDSLLRDNAGSIRGRLMEFIGAYTAVNKFLHDRVWTNRDYTELSELDKKFLRALLIKKLTAYHYLWDPFIHDFDITYEQLQTVTEQDRPDMNRCTASTILGEGRSLRNLKERVESNYFNILLHDEDPEFDLHAHVDADELLEEFHGTCYDTYIPYLTNISTNFLTGNLDDDGGIEDIGITLHKFPYN